VAAADILPFGDDFHDGTIVSEAGQTASGARVAHVCAKYFETLGLSIVRGRAFTSADVAANAPVAIVNETLGRRLWPAADPVGHRVRARPDDPWLEVVGVAADGKYVSLTESPVGAYYLPLKPGAGGTFVIRSADNPLAARDSLTDIASDLDPDLPVASAQTMDERIRRTLNLRRAVVSLLGVLGALTLMLASVGIYGMAAHNVSTRTRELGIRISLGARASDILRMIIRENVVLSLVGVATGVALSAIGAKMLASYLFGVAAADPATFAGGALVLCFVSLVAGYLPARRAARLDPVLSLRRE
jgi:putative ABC transport system permease protein